jgi:hypothetical protein
MNNIGQSGLSLHIKKKLIFKMLIDAIRHDSKVLQLIQEFPLKFQF